MPIWHNKKGPRNRRRPTYRPVGLNQIEQRKEHNDCRYDQRETDQSCYHSSHYARPEGTRSANCKTLDLKVCWLARKRSVFSSSAAKLDASRSASSAMRSRLRPKSDSYVVDARAASQRASNAASSSPERLSPFNNSSFAAACIVMSRTVAYCVSFSTTSSDNRTCFIVKHFPFFVTRI